MKVLVATKEGQGLRKNDFSWSDIGELVRFGMDCDGEAIDGNCGCRRSLSGMTSHKSTTTFKVADMQIEKKKFRELFKQSIIECGWTTEPINSEWEEMINTESNELLRLADAFPIGMVLERRGSKIQQRLVIVD